MSTPRWSVALALALLALALASCSSSPPGASTPANGTTVQVITAGTVPWLAAQDGTGAWKTLSGTSFTVTDSAGRYGLAWVCMLGSGQNQVEVVQATTSDASSVRASCQTTPAAATGSISVVVTNIPSGGAAVISIGGQVTGGSTTGTQASFSLSGIATGSQTVIAFGVDSGGYLASAYVHRNVTINSGANSGITVDLADPTYATTSGLSVPSLTASGAPSTETYAVAIAYITGAASPNALTTTYPQASVAYTAVPSTLAQATDRYLFTADAYTSGYDTGSAGDDQHAIFVAHQPGTTTDLSVPGALPSAAGIGVSAGTAVATWGSPSFSTAGGATAFLASVTPGAPSPIWSVQVSAAWLGSATSYAFPDFTATSGWNSGWNFPTGVTADARVEAAHANLTLDQLLSAVNGTADPNSYPNGTSIELTQRLDVGGTY